jgi:hypothetical protein
VLRVNLEGLFLLFVAIAAGLCVFVQISTRNFLEDGFKTAVDSLVDEALTSECGTTRALVESQMEPALRHDWMQETFYGNSPLTIEDVTKYALHGSVVSHTQWAFIYASYIYAPSKWGFSGWHREIGAPEADYWYYTDTEGMCHCWSGSSPDNLNMTAPLFSFPIDAAGDAYVTGPLAARSTPDADAGHFTSLYPYTIINTDGTTSIDIFVTHGHATSSGDAIFSVDVDLASLNVLLEESASSSAGAVAFILDIDGWLVASSSHADLVDDDGGLVPAASSADLVIAASAAALPFPSEWPLPGDTTVVGPVNIHVSGERYLLSYSRVSVGNLAWLVCRLEPKDIPYGQWRSSTKAASRFSTTLLCIVLGGLALVGLLIVSNCYVTYASRFNYQYSAVDTPDADDGDAMNAGAEVTSIELKQ